MNLLNDYLLYLTRTGHRIQLVNKTQKQLAYLVLWIESEDVNDTLLRCYEHHLRNELDLETGELVRINTRRERLAKARRFMKWINDQDVPTTKTPSINEPTLSIQGSSSCPA